MDEPWPADDLAAAEALDRQIDRALAGVPEPGTEPAVLWLTAAIRTEPPAGVARRVEAEATRRERARWRPAQLAAAALAALLLAHGISSMVNGAWVAEGLGEDYSPHAYIEGGLALAAAGVVVAAGLFRRAWLAVSTAGGVPLGIALGIRGVTELGHFPAGAALHLTEGAVAVVLAVLWWRARYRTGPGAEGGAWNDP